MALSTELVPPITLVLEIDLGQAGAYGDDEAEVRLELAGVPRGRLVTMRIGGAAGSHTSSGAAAPLQLRIALAGERATVQQDGKPEATTFRFGRAGEAARKRIADDAAVSVAAAAAELALKEAAAAAHAESAAGRAELLRSLAKRLEGARYQAHFLADTRARVLAELRQFVRLELVPVVGEMQSVEEEKAVQDAIVARAIKLREEVASVEIRVEPAAEAGAAGAAAAAAAAAGVEKRHADARSSSHYHAALDGAEEAAVRLHASARKLRVELGDVARRALGATRPVAALARFSPAERAEIARLYEVVASGLARDRLGVDIAM